MLLALLLGPGFFFGFGSAAPARADFVWTFEPSHLVPELPDQVSLGLAVDFNSGKFDTGDRWDTLSFQPAVRIESDNVFVRLALPFHRLVGPIDPDRSGSQSEFGLGDLNFDLGYTLYPVVRGGPFFDFVTRVKAPTADDDFGTGKTDVTLLISGYQMVGYGFAVIGDFGVRLRGGDTYDDTLQAAFILGRQTKGQIGLWLAYDWRESPTVDFGGDEVDLPDEHDLTPFVSIPISKHLRVDPYAVIGLSQGSPDWGIGTSVWWKF